jgi:hypothetical protein
MEQGSKRSTDVFNPATGKYESVFNYDGLTDALPLVNLYPQMRRGLEAMYPGDQAAKEKFLAERYGLKGSKLVPGQIDNRVTVNSGDGGSKKKLYAIPFNDVSEMDRYKLKTNYNGDNYAVQEMDLGTEGAATPWIQNIKTDNGTEQNINGRITKLILDNRGGLYARIVGTYEDGSTNNVVQDVKVTSAILKALQDNGIDVTPIRKVWGNKNNPKTEGLNQKITKKYPLPKGQPQTVTQNGYTYTWNENTGQYE